MSFYFWNNPQTSACEKCNGRGFRCNDSFERAQDRVMDTQGLSYGDSALQVMRSSLYRDDWEKCECCK